MKTYEELREEVALDLGSSGISDKKTIDYAATRSFIYELLDTANAMKEFRVDTATFITNQIQVGLNRITNLEN